MEDRVQVGLKHLGLVVAYLLIAKVNELLFDSNGAVAYLWLAVGLTLVVLLEGGYKYLPAIFVGALLGNWLTGFSFEFSFHNAVRHALATFIGVLLLKREGHFDARLFNVADFLRIAVLALLIGMLVAGFAEIQRLIASTAFLEFNMRGFYQRFGGNSLGVLFVMPLLLVWRHPPHEWAQSRRATEAALIIGVTFLVGQVIFLDWLHDSLGLVARGYWMFLFITWAAVRLELHGVVLILVITAIQGLLGAQLGLGFFSNDIAKTHLANYYFYMICLSGTGMSLATYISARKRDESELLRYKDHLEDEVKARTQELEISNRDLTETTSAMDRAGIGIHWINADTGRFLYVNEYAAHLLGYRQEELSALGVPYIDPDYTFEDFRARTMPLRELGAAVVQTTELHKDGRSIPIEVSFYYIPDKDELPPRFISFITDITQRKQAEAEILSARDAAEAANKAKSTFLANMSHELRTPLNAILGFSSLMRKDPQLLDAQRVNLDIINRSGQHLLTLINDILEMAKIEAGRVQLENAPFDLGGMVRDVTDMMDIRAKDKDLRLLVDQSSAFPRYILGDEARLSQVLINLVGNAIKFTQQGGVTIRLGTRENLTSHLMIEVEDSGPGISPEDQERLFQPFVQLGNQGDSKGTGLGLAITRQFVQLMGGSIDLESAPGKGSIFRIDLPLNAVKEADIAKPAEMVVGDVEGLAPGQPTYRILIVEDQLENQLLLTQLMERIGLTVKLAKNGEQGVQLFLSWHPHLIWMDRRMPEMDGIAATQAIRQLPGGKEVKIVAVTASAFMEERDEMLAAGMDDFVRKPYRFNEIYDSLTRQLGVQYTYAEARDNAEQSPPVALTAEMLAVLPQELRRELHDALESLDAERISTAIQRVAPIDAQLHKLLSQLAGCFNYPIILNALQMNQPKDAA